MTWIPTRPIDTKEEYKEAMTLLNSLMEIDPPKGTPDGDRLRLIAALIFEYEEEQARRRSPVALGDLAPPELKLLGALVNLGTAIHRNAPYAVTRECRKAVAIAEYDAGPIKRQRVYSLVAKMHADLQAEAANVR